MNNYVIRSEKYNEKFVEAARLLAMGFTVNETSKTTGIEKANILTALADDEFSHLIRANKEFVAFDFSARLSAAAKRAIDIIIDTMAEDLSKTENRKNLLLAAKMALDAYIKLSGESNVQTHAVLVSQINPEPNTIDIIAKRIKQLSSPQEEVVDVESVYDIEGVVPSHVCHPETHKGVLNISDNGMKQCHICGKWIFDLAAHALQNHSIEKEEYESIFHLDSI